MDFKWLFLQWSLWVKYIVPRSSDFTNPLPLLLEKSLWLEECTNTTGHEVTMSTEQGKSYKKLVLPISAFLILNIGCLIVSLVFIYLFIF